jgi:hypothetical protein
VNQKNLVRYWKNISKWSDYWLLNFLLTFFLWSSIFH